VLHRVVREHLETWLAEGRARSAWGEGYPFYVEKELRDLLRCGDLSQGFARLRCAACGHEQLLAFSCKRRGLCPSCSSRRMSDEAAWLVDSLLPEAPYRQWTITFPFSLRLALARDPRLLAEVFGIAIRGLFAWQRRQARRAGVLGAKTAAVLAVQRFGGALNLNVHGHAIVPDGVFVLAERRYRFVPLAAPSKDDLVALTTRLARRVTALLERRYAHRDEPPLGPVEGALAEAMRHPFLPASPVGPDTTADDEDDLRRCASVDGFALHADTAVAAADRLGLERLCRYGLRPAFSQDRLALTPDGRVQVSLRKPWPHRSGSRVLTLEPLAFLRRLAALTPPPYVHLLRHYGLFAPRAKGRERLPSPPPSPFGPRPQRLPPHSASSAAHPAPPQPPQPPCLPAPPAKASATSAALLEATSAPAPAPDARPPALDPNLPSTLPEAPSPWPGEPASRPPRTRLPWHELLRRVFAIDVLVCPRCAGPLTVLAYLTEAAVVDKILTHLGLPTRPPPIAPARSPEQQDLFEPTATTVGTRGNRRDQATPTAARAPPHPPESDDADLERTVDETMDWGA